MILPLAAAILIGKYGALGVARGQADKSVFAKLFPNATGQNGFEDYVKAGELLGDPAFSVFQYWLPADKRPSPEEQRQADDARKKLLASMTPEERKGAEVFSDHLSPEDRELTDRLNGLNFLQTRQEEVAKFQRSLDLLTQGNNKPFEYATSSGELPDDDADEQVVVLTRHLAYLASDAAFVDFSAGDSSHGTDILIQGLYMAHRIGSANVRCRLASSSLTSTILRQFNEHLGAISLADSVRVATVADSLLDDRGDFASMIKNEKKRLARELDSQFKTDAANPPPQGEDSPLGRQFLALSPAQKEAFLQKVHQKMNDQLDSLSQRFDSPEENWLAVGEPQPPPASEPQNLDQLATALAELLAPGIDHEVTLVVMRSRTQIRLLRLHSRIIQYRWETGRLPTTLNEMKLPREATYDPLSRAFFKYEPNLTTYKLSSAGVPETGPIELRYRAPQNRSTHDPDRP